MDILAGIMGFTTMFMVVFGIGFMVLGQRIGTWKRLTSKEDGSWQRKLSDIGFNYVMPSGILITVALLPILVLLGVITFIVTLFVL